MTFNQEYYYTLLVTAETQNQPADAIPVLLLAAYKQQLQTGSSLPLIYHQRKLFKEQGLQIDCSLRTSGIRETSWNHPTISKGSFRKKLF